MWSCNIHVNHHHHPVQTWWSTAAERSICEQARAFWPQPSNAQGTAPSARFMPGVWGPCLGSRKWEFVRRWDFCGRCFLAEGFFFLKGLAKRFFLKGLAEPSVEFELQQAIGEGLFPGSSFAASYWGRTIRRVFFCSKLLGKDHPQGLLLQQAIGEGLSAGSLFAASYWGKTIRRVFFCSKLLGKDHPQGLLLQQALGESPFVGLFFPARLLGKSNLWSLLWVFFCSKLLGMS